MSQKSALILGASGLIGGHCLDYLLSDQYYTQVVALVRRPLMVEHPKLIQQQVSFDQLDDCLSGYQTDDVYCCLGTTIKKAGSKKAFYEVDFVYPTEIAKLSISNGAEQFLFVSAIGANPSSKMFYNRIKGEVEEALGKCGFKGFYTFRPSLLLGERLDRRPAEQFGKIIFQWFAPFFKGFLKRYKPINGKAVAYAMVKLAKAMPLGKQVIESHEVQSMYDQRQGDGDD